MNERFLQIREALGLNQRDFGKEIGLTSSGISNIEKGIRNVTDKHILLLRQAFDVNENWLRTGEGEMFSEPPSDPAATLCEKYKLPHSFLSILRAFLDMKDTERKIILDFAHRAAADMVENDFESLRPYLMPGDTSPGLMAARGGDGTKIVRFDEKSAEELRELPNTWDDI